MKKILNYAKSALLLLAFSFALIGCSNETAFDLQEESLNLDNSEVSARNGTQYHFNTSLNGKNAGIATKAVGQGIVKISKDETKIHFKLIVANIEDVFGAHFHWVPPGSPTSNGPVVVPLYGGGLTSANGVLAEGDIMAGDVKGLLDGDLDALIAAIRSGEIYINVHTSANPSGEIRGWL